ncbi:hypothetical protein CPY51_26190 [Rhizobium tubonense]|uniref:Uncharacterized protein n=1 Tax=Rhizobium tubonense TaxID=484088 RepID=A0A2W4C8M6_9HYPH|nr:hypothetical protein CPY51_26190 [Rhizobium tubonense]
MPIENICKNDVGLAVFGRRSVTFCEIELADVLFSSITRKFGIIGDKLSHRVRFHGCVKDG